MDHQNYIHQAITLAKTAQLNGNLPYACLLVDSEGQVLLEGLNTVITKPDLIGHAEINLIQEASKHFGVEFLKSCTIYTSDEPCSMCASAIYWAGIGRLVYGLSKQRFYQEFGRGNPDWDFEFSSRKVLEKGARPTEVIGPMLEDEVIKLHKGKYSE